jgi:hypothetical protein
VLISQYDLKEILKDALDVGRKAIKKKGCRLERALEKVQRQICQEARRTKN